MIHTETTVACYCGGTATLKSNSIIYGKEYGNGKAYICENFTMCKGYVGAHADGRPLGTIVDNDTKILRQKVHETIDPLWKKKKYRRSAVYRMIAEALGMERFHTGESDAGICREVLRIVPLIFNKK